MSLCDSKVNLPSANDPLSHELYKHGNIDIQFMAGAIVRGHYISLTMVWGFLPAFAS
ncbi:transmembrane protein, putative [Medicago truncatula]|uniref:Transmembrane protein, putative n=1 Tax=Medicago truncatula TaxID=3880 RepID=G7K1T7_MEDTR|nr:transmembrane protein, putative [Medicago truncatula]